MRCAIYTRKSTEEGLEQEFNSLDAQRSAEAVRGGQDTSGCYQKRNRNARVDAVSTHLRYTSNRFNLPVLSPSFSVGTPTLSSMVRYRFVNGVASPG